MSRCIVSAGVFALLLMGGCGSTSQPKEKAEVAPAAAQAAVPAPTPATTAPTTQPTSEDEPITSSQALAWKTAAHVRELEEQLNRRPKPAPAQVPPEKVAASQPSPIVWLEPAKTQPTATPKQPAETKVEVPTTQFVEAPPLPTNPTTVPAAISKVEPIAQPVAPIKVEPKPPVVTTDQFEARLAQQIKDYPRDLAAQLDYQVLQWVRGRQVPQADAITQLPAEDREILSALMDALSNFRSNVRGNDNLLLAQKVRPFVEMADRLRPQASLRIPTIALCQRVQGFGVYDPIDANRFIAGRNNKVIVYCEVENFAAFLNDQRMWQTNLTQETVVYDDRGQRVWVEKRQPFKDLARNRRRDFCVAREIRLPASLVPGQYSIVVSIADQQANRMAEATTLVQLLARTEPRPATQPSPLESLLLRH